MRHSALDVLEDSLNLLLAQPSSAWVRYLFGQIPLLLATLSFAEDMASGYRSERCLLDSFIVTVCFFWAAFWRCRFSGILLATAAGDPGLRRASGSWQCTYLQLILQSFKLILFPLAVVSILPLGWFSSFFRNTSLESDRDGSTLRGVIRRSATRASAASTTYWAGLLILMLFSCVLFVNLLIAGALLPQLLKAFTGSESSWTRNAGHILNFNLLAIAAVATWLLVDPLSQAFSVLNSFYFDARSNGQDLMRELRRLAAGAAIFVVVAQFASSETRQSVSVEDLDRGVQSALTLPEFQWQTSPSGRGTSLLADRIYNDTRRFIKPIRSLFTRLGKSLRKLLRQDPVPGAGASNRTRPPSNLSIVLYAAGALVLAIVLLSFVRGRSPRQTPRVNESATPKDSPDPSREDLLGTELPEDEWLSLARRYAEGGEYRLSVRALYLSNLAYLGSRKLIAVAKSKTNGSYERELRMRAPALEISSAFAAANFSFEKAWYGRHSVDAEAAVQSERYTQIIRQLCSVNDRASLSS